HLRSTASMSKRAKANLATPKRGNESQARNHPRNTPSEVVAFLRDYHDRLGKAVFENGGTLDKYLGDGLMATFGTPDPGSDDAENALNCAFEMLSSLEKWNREREANGSLPVHIGIGVHYGPVISGDIGNQRRLEYSVIGDTVNVASRLETLTRMLNTSLVVSNDLIESISQRGKIKQTLTSKLKLVGMQDLRGKSEQIGVWIYETSSTNQKHLSRN
ncbi:adenylate/guanylate cyclase domain-containing protein, partial [Ruegeria sp. 2205SS24-7]|uniref:adenylate/guanylate cyclase domain-containing protein n=1 Tax=Ruegeria discodermiae TaxID=3064389 RepID=UPI002740ACFE